MASVKKQTIQTPDGAAAFIRWLEEAKPLSATNIYRFEDGDRIVVVWTENR